jgi:hypothetical protein
MTVDIGSLQPSNFKAGKISFEIGGPSAMWGPGGSMWHEYYIFVVRLWSCTAIKRVWRLQLDFLRGNINDWGKDLQAMF